MSTYPVGPINSGSDMRVGVVKAEHDVLDFLERAMPAWQHLCSPFLLEQATYATAGCCTAAGHDALAARRQRAVEAAATLMAAIILMDAGR